MKLTYNWLKAFVDLKEPPQKIAELLTMAGLEVESLSPLPQEKEGAKDWLMEIAVTPNRGDCLGILGLAREVAALTGRRLRLPPVSRHTHDSSVRRLLQVKIIRPSLCPRYSARMVQGVRVAPSPAWMRLRLEACGIRSIDSVVDITNWVMMETGQPLHAFDFDQLNAKRVVVRPAGELKKFLTLDRIERELAPEDLLICDGETPIAIAGIMGGENSEVRPDTRRVLLESAHFDPLSIRHSAKRLGVHSEASHRFERGVDPEGTLFALDRAVFLLGEITGATPVPGLVDCYPVRKKSRPLLLRVERVQRLLGHELKQREIEVVLKSLGIKIQGRSRSGIKVLPPSYRSDLSREVDFIEELARIHGYEKIPSRLPLVRPQGSSADLRLRHERRIRAFLTGEGLTELINLPFTSREMNQRFYGLWQERRAPVLLLNPLVQENSEMRLSLIPGLVGNLRHHIGQKVRNFCGFELGRVFSLEPGEERQHLAGLLHGQRERSGLRAGEMPFGFLDIKGLIEGILELVGMKEKVIWTRDEIASFLHPGKAASVYCDGSRLGYLGEVHPDLCETLNLPRFLIFEFDFERWVQYAPPELTVRPLSRFPSVERDLAVVVEEAFPAQRIIDWIKDRGHALMEDVQVFDQYRGSSIPEGKKSLAYTISYRAENKTLTDAEVNALHQELVAQISQVFGAQLRG